MGLSDFREGLQRVMQSPHERPFVCRQSPLDCRVFVVGINPANRMSAPFWTYWDDDEGFLYDKWLSDYRAERIAAHKQSLGATRLRLNRLSGALERYGVHCLETNLYAWPTKRKPDLDATRRRTAVFEYLLQNIQPTILILHGKDAAAIVPPMVPGLKTIPIEHLFNVSYDRVDQTVEQVLAELRERRGAPEGVDPSTGSDYYHHPEMWHQESEEAWLHVMNQRSALVLCQQHCDAKCSRKNLRTNGDVSYFCPCSPGRRAVTIRPSNARLDIYNIAPHQVPEAFQRYIHDRTRPHLRVPLHRWGEEVRELIDIAFNC